jgi:uncharacterized membrane protein
MKRGLSTLDVLTLGILAGGVALTAAVYTRLPDPMPTHFGVDGRPNGWMPRAVGAWVALAVGIAVVLLLRFGAALMPSDWRERFQASPMHALSLVVACLLTGVHLLALKAALGGGSHAMAMPALWLMLGGGLAVLAQLLPRTRRNPFFGVRTAWALTSDENWARTQRVGSYTLTIGGILAAVAGLLHAPHLALAAILVSAFLPVLWSWRLAKRGT